jgi:hypothetical protein
MSRQDLTRLGAGVMALVAALLTAQTGLELSGPLAAALALAGLDLAAGFLAGLLYERRRAIARERAELRGSR